MKLAEKLAAWLEAGRADLGEVRIGRTAEGFELHHYLDEPGELQSYQQAEDAIELGKLDAAGKYRPLRSAPTLQRGWRLELGSLEDVVRALEFFYPAMLGTAAAFEEKAGRPVDLRETLNRQSGMYRVAGKITNEQADALIGEVCPPNRCLKTITWQIEPGVAITSLPAGKLELGHDLLECGRGFIPLPCEECCNILVAAARETVKRAPA
ncbi:MAG: DR2241 family protein [Chthoniobacterales bacterium]